ncbi:MAG: hypothetical protein IKY94_05445 [Lachnospiraceae bacterium]|nr:hypothetical protein [Lachnospiraceae bacterium]
MSKRINVEDLLSPHSTINPAEEIPEDDDIFADDELEEDGEEDIFSDTNDVKEYDLFNISDESDEDDNDPADDDSEEYCFCGVTVESDEDDDVEFEDDFHDDDDDVIPTPFGFGLVTNKPIVNQYVTVEFEVKDEFKPAFKTILSIMKMFKDDFIPYKERVFIIDGLVKNINLHSKKINWTGWRETVTDNIFDCNAVKKTCQFTLDDLKTSGVPLHSIEKNVIPVSYFERERLNREFLDCFQEEEGKDGRDIIIPSWKELTDSDCCNYVFFKIINIRKDPVQADGNEKVYCTVRFNTNHLLGISRMIVGKFIGTFGSYTSIYENPLIPALKAKFLIGDDSTDEQVELVITRDNGITTDKLYINGFEDVKDNISIFRRELEKLPDEIIISLQDINKKCLLDLSIELKPELNKSLELLANYIKFKKNSGYVSTRDMLMEIFDLFKMESSVSKQYIRDHLGGSINRYEFMSDDEKEMLAFADTLPHHLKKLVKDVYPLDRKDETEERALCLYSSLHEMLNYIEDIEVMRFRFESDDRKEDTRAYIQLKFTLVGTNLEDIRYHLKSIKPNTADIKYMYKEL